VFGAGWRVTAETTLFDYAEGESVDTLYDPLFPPERVEARDIRGEARRKAEAACREAGVTGSINFDDCILDVGLTGDVGFAESAAMQPPDTTRLEIRDGSPGTPGPQGPAAPSTSATTGGAATLTAPAELSSGSPFALEWTGPANDGDYVSVAAPDDPASKYVSYRYTRLGSPVEMTAPDPPGEYELRYVQGQSREILATRRIDVTAAAATLTAAAKVSSGAPFALEWTGPGNSRDYVSVATPDDPASKYVSYRYTRLGSPVEMTAPDLPGEYELRYVQGQSREILATRRIEVTAVAATLTAPGRVAPGAELSVEWMGPANNHDYVSFASPEDSASKYDSYGYTRLGSPLKMKAPKEPGSYELRYIQGQSRTILARRPIAVR
jgi:hypothetical protein